MDGSKKIEQSNENFTFPSLQSKSDELNSNSFGGFSHWLRLKTIYKCKGTLEKLHYWDKKKFDALYMCMAQKSTKIKIKKAKINGKNIQWYCVCIANCLNVLILIFILFRFFCRLLLQLLENFFALHLFFCCCRSQHTANRSSNSNITHTITNTTNNNSNKIHLKKMDNNVNQNKNTNKYIHVYGARTISIIYRCVCVWVPQQMCVLPVHQFNCHLYSHHTALWEIAIASINGFESWCECARDIYMHTYTHKLQKQNHKTKLNGMGRMDEKCWPENGETNKKNGKKHWQNGTEKMGSGKMLHTGGNSDNTIHAMDSLWPLAIYANYAY